MSAYKDKTQLQDQIRQDQDLYITGGSALVINSQPPNVTQYHGLFYDPLSLLYQEEVQNQKMASRNIHSVTPLHREMSNICSDYASVGDGRQSQGGFFTPKPPKYSNELIYETSVQSTFSRPSSAYSMGRTVVSRPGSAVRKITSRNDSRVNTPSQGGRQYGSPDLQIDPDHEPIGDVLSRLGDYTKNFLPETTLACIDCECTGTDERVPSRLAKVYCSDVDDEEEDTQDVSLEVLFRTFTQYQDKGHSANRQKAMVTLINSYSLDQQVSQTDLKKVLSYLMQSVVPVQEACLILLKQLVKNTSNLEYLLDRDILSYLNNCLLSPALSDLRRQALLLSEVILTQHQFKEKWMDFVVSKFLPKLLSMVRGQIPLDVKYASCCVFRPLAQYEEFIGYVTEDILPAVILLRNASAKFKEVYVEILTTVLSHTDSVPPDLVDSSAIPITVSIIREGPCGAQCAALHLLTSLTANDNGVAIVTGTNNLVAMVLCCMKDSHCRRVKLNALEVMKQLSHSHKIGLCKDLMLQLSGYLIPSLEEESLTCLSQATSKSPSPVKPRFDEERHMWQGLEKFIDLLRDIVFREGKVESDDFGLVSAVNLTPGVVDVSKVQLQMLTAAFHVLQNICVWPLDRSRLGFGANKLDLTSFLDECKQKAHLSKVNRGLTQIIWDKVGVVACDLLLAYSEQFQKQTHGTSPRKQTYDLSIFLESEEIHLVHSLLEFLLCASLCTCVGFPEIIPKLESPSKKKSKSKLKSSSASAVGTEHSGSSVHSKLKSQSDIPRGFKAEAEKLWVKESPHLTQINPGSGSYNTATVAKSKAELQYKEACTDRRLLRKCLYEAGIIQSVCPFLKCSQPEVQVLVLQILRGLVHPLEERVVPKLSFNAQGSSSKAARQRPQTAGSRPDTNRQLNMALHKMSPEIAKLINEALVLEEKKDDKTVMKVEKQKVKNVLNIPDDGDGGLESIHERLQDYTEAEKEEKQKKEEEAKKKKERPMIDRCRPIALQCRESILLETGDRLLEGIFSKSQLTKKHYVLLLHDLVYQGELDIHMKLSTHGCIPKLVDFLRVNENNELLEIIGLIIARILVSSDARLRQLFNRHGGQQLLLSMAQYTSGLIKQEVSTTLKTISKLETPSKKRPVSAPVIRGPLAQKVPDIWDHIQERWKHEDQVTDVLRKWSIEDRKLHRKK